MFTVKTDKKLSCCRQAARCFASLNILLEVTENGTVRKLVYDFLFAFHENYGRIFVIRFDTIHERDGHPASTPA